MEEAKPSAVNGRRSRARIRSLVCDGADALDESARLARRGDLRGAERAARLAERQAKAAGQLFDLDAALTRLAKARRDTDAYVAQRLEQLKTPAHQPPKFTWSVPPGAEPEEVIMKRVRAALAARDVS